MSRTFTRERCIPWLFSRKGAAVEGEPREVAADVDALLVRQPHRGALGLRMTGVAGLFAAAIVLMIAARPARAEGSAGNTSAITTAGYTIGGLSVGAFAVGRRIGRNAPAFAVLCAGREAALDESALAELVAGARKNLVERSYPEGQVWLVAEAPLSAASKARAAALEVRCFAPVGTQIAEL